ncbi:MAG: hydrogenase 4 subunit B [Rhodospirillales bacterium]|nr:hydrogenase 4 subunit B [Rhodospirillales bacterium]
MTLALIACGFLFALGVLGAARARMPDGVAIVYGTSFWVMAVLLLVGLTALAGPPEGLRLPLFLPWIGARFRLDALSGFFLVVTGMGGAAASLYAMGYGRHAPDQARVLPFYPVFLAGLVLSLLAADAFTFLFAWEVMSLGSWVLVLAHHHDPASRRAGVLYLLMAAFSALALLLCFGLLAGPAGAYSFAQMRAAHPGPTLAAIVFALALIGTGAKAGLVPLHVWLPEAHPAAPSHVSALMSGVMTKVAVYAFLRIVFDLLGGGTWWEAVAVLALAGATAVLGVLQALMQQDLKRLLAWSTIENIGIVYIGLGLALAFRADGFALGAALALTAALFHVFNHAAFKSLLFFGAGSVQTATGTRDIERLGGLIHRMGRTGVLFLIGCAAIAGLPPLNGFVSEWLTFQAILLHPDLAQWGLKVMVPADGALLALAAALAGVCFVRAFGITFLGRARSEAAERAAEVDGFSRAAMTGLAALCLLGGIFPGVIADAIAPVARLLLGTRLPAQHALAWLRLVPVSDARGSYDGLLIFLFVAAATALTAAAIHRFASRALRRGPAWDCGFPDPSPRTQYTAASFAQPIRRVFAAPLFGAREVVTMPPPGDPAPARIVKTLSDPIWERGYAPVAAGVLRVAGRLNRLQFLTIRRYLGFVFLALVLLLLAVGLWR